MISRLTFLALVVTVLAWTPTVAHAEDYSARLRTAIADLPLKREVRKGYEREKFPHWSDADGDGCSTREEVLKQESKDPVTVTGTCTITSGRWFSYYDQETWEDPSDVDIDHMVPLAEAWDSGARTWKKSVRESFANDLGDRRSLVGVTDNVNQSKGDRDPAEWLPEHSQCRYLRGWVAVKHRWRLRVDSTEKAALETVAADCRNRRITVTLAR